MKLSVIDYGHNSDLPEHVRGSMDDGMQTIFRAVLNSHLRDGRSEMHAYAKAYRFLSDTGYERQDGRWVAKESPTVGDVHVDAPLGSRKEDERKFVPPFEVIEAAKAGSENQSAIVQMIAKGEGITEEQIRAIDGWGGKHTAKWIERCLRKLDKGENGDAADEHADSGDSDSDLDSQITKLASGETEEVIQAKDAAQVSPDTFELQEVAKAGNGVMVAFWPSADVCQRLAVKNGESTEEMHVTLAYLGKLSAVDIQKLPALESALQSFAATHAAVSGTIGGPGRFNATEHSDGKDVAIAMFDSPQIQDFRRELVESIEAAGLSIHKDFAYTPHLTLAYIDPGAKLPVQRIEPIAVTFGSIVLSIGSARKVYPLTGAPPDTFELIGKIVKADEEQRLVFGWFSIVEINGEPVIDSQGDRITPEVLENAAYNYVLTARVASELHETVGVGELVESIVFTNQKVQAIQQSLTDQNIPAAISIGCQGWWGGFRLDADVFAKVKSGEYKEFSIGGRGKRMKIAA